MFDVATDDRLQYKFYPVSKGSIQFKVRASNDARLAFTSGPQECDPMYEVYIGGWSNTKSVIRKNRNKPDKAEAKTPKILNKGEFRGFWICWEGGVISVGHEGQDTPFLSWCDPEPVPICFVGVSTGHGASGAWKIETLCSAPPGCPGVNSGNDHTGQAPESVGVWVDESAGKVPLGAIVSGRDVTGEPLFIARAQHKGALIPGKVVVSHKCAYVPWGGKEHSKHNYQVLIGGSNKWLPTHGSKIPPGAFPGGHSESGEHLYIGRVHHEGILTIGKVLQTHSGCYIPYDGKELHFSNYEILVLNHDC